MNGDDSARALADRYWDELLEIEPLLGTMVGDERFDDRLSDPSPAGRAKAELVHRAAIDEIEHMDLAGLDESSRATMDMLEAIARRFLSDIEHRTDRLGVASHLWGPGNLLADLGSMQRADTPERLDRYVARLQAIPSYLDKIGDVAEEAIAARVTVPAVVADRALSQVERLLSIPAENSPALAPAGEDPGARERVTAAIRDAVNPAYAAYLDELKAYQPHATETIGMTALPDGEAMYAAQILAWTTLPLGAQEVHDLGVERLEAIQEERRALAGSLGFSDATEAITAHGASGENTASSREELLDLAKDQVRRGWEAAPAMFGRTPKANCEVRLVEEFREADMPFAFYQSPTEDGSRPGVYYVNSYNLPDRQVHHLATTSYHEANPGHHFQISIEQEIEDRPALRRFGGILAGSAFCEGWGLYSERLADQMELFRDGWERMGMLEAQGLRAARLVTDTGIHALGWTRDRAIEKLEEAGIGHTDAVIEIDRYIALPGQALSYMIGMIEIERARDRALAAGSTLQQFHDRVLGLGQLPLPSLRRETAG